MKIKVKYLRFVSVSLKIPSDSVRVKGQNDVIDNEGHFLSPSDRQTAACFGRTINKNNGI